LFSFDQADSELSFSFYVPRTFCDKNLRLFLKNPFNLLKNDVPSTDSTGSTLFEVVFSGVGSAVAGEVVSVDAEGSV